MNKKITIKILNNYYLFILQNYTSEEIDLIEFYLNPIVDYKKDLYNDIFFMTKEKDKYIIRNTTVELKANSLSSVLNRLNYIINVYLLEDLYKNNGKEIGLILHGSCFVYNDFCVLIIGDSGNGKSTLLKEYLDKGAYFVCDDTIIIDKNNNIIPYFSCIRFKSKELINQDLYVYESLDMQYLKPRKRLNYKAKVNIILFLDKKFDTFEKKQNFEIGFLLKFIKHKCGSNYVSMLDIINKLLKNVKCYTLNEFDIVQKEKLNNYLERVGL